MRWALLGAIDEFDAVVRMFAAAPGVELVRVPETEWESLFVSNDCTAVVVCGVFGTGGQDESLRSEQLKKLVGAGIPVIAVHPAVDLLTAYEIEAIRRDTGGTIVAFAPGWHHPAWELLCDLITMGSESPLGLVEHISFERHVGSRQRGSVLTQFGHDVHILRRMLGNITSVNAVGDLRSDGCWNSLTVNLASDVGRSANWTLAAPSTNAESRVSASGNQASATLAISGTPTRETWELRDSLGYQEVFPEWNDASKLVEQLSTEGGTKSLTPSWSETCLDLEIAETASKSLQRKRAIDLYTTNRSEEKTFKGFMAAAGCVVLLAVLVTCFGLALWDGYRAPFREPIAPALKRSADEQPDHGPLWIRLWPLYPLLVFLLLQFLVFVARRPAKEIPKAADS